ncbi:MAG: hypothetical protein D6798_12165, partial [Deltaproteobacteria bacterium]
MPPDPLLLLTALTTLAAAEPASTVVGLVTTTRGTVRLDDRPAPPVPFLVGEDARLELGDDGEVVVLVGGVALHRTGPGVVSLDPCAPPAVGAAAAPCDPATGATWPELLQHRAERGRAGATRGASPRRSSTARAGATRAATVQLVRPVPGGRLLELPDELRWRCAGPCPDATVRLRAVDTGVEAWSGNGAGHLPLPDVALSPGLWELQVGGDSFAFEVPGPDEAGALVRALVEADRAAATLP